MDRIDMGVLVVLFNPGDDDLEHLGELAAAFPQLRFLAVDNSPHSLSLIHILSKRRLA